MAARDAGAAAGRAVDVSDTGLVKPGVAAEPSSPMMPKCRPTAAARYTWFGRARTVSSCSRSIIATSSDVFHRLGGTAPRWARSRAPMRPTRGGWSRPAAEEVQAIIALDPAGDLVVGPDVELQHDGVRAHEAHPPGGVGGDGDASPGQLRFEGPEGSVVVEQLGDHGVRR